VATPNVRTARGRSQPHSPRPTPEEMFAGLLDAVRRGQTHRVQSIGASLSRLGFWVERVGDTGGVRLVPPQREIRADILPLPRPPRMPVAWFARLDRALVDGDRELEEIAQEELASLGYIVTTDQPGRRDR